jgi:micrococcal nuclease
MTAGFMKYTAIAGRMFLRRRSTLIVALTLSAVVVAALFAAAKLSSSPSSTINDPPPADGPACPRSVGLCIERIVTRVLDGDTLDVEGGLRIRLVLVDAPELSESGGPEARDYLADLCLGSLALIDEDDFQIGDDPYSRVLAVAHCGGTNANAAMISTGRAETFYVFCSESEFGNLSWTGCSSPPPPPPPPPPGNCDPAYPDVCIAPPPPDLDCGQISFRNFRVLAPDPHNFDGDGDGIGCET